MISERFIKFFRSPGKSASRGVQKSAEGAEVEARGSREEGGDC